MKHHDSIEELNRLLKVRLEEWQLREKDRTAPAQAGGYYHTGTRMRRRAYC